MIGNTPTFFFTLGLFALSWVATPQGKKKVPSTHREYTYRADILPLLKANCNPCHFPGGKVYDEYPFDRFKTVASLGLKLNTRLKDDEQKVVRQWVESGKADRSSPPK